MYCNLSVNSTFVSLLVFCVIEAKLYKFYLLETHRSNAVIQAVFEKQIALFIRTEF